MHGFHWKDHHLHVDDVPVAEIAAAVGTPTYMYSASSIRSAYHRLEAIFSPLRAHLHYAVKACPNLNICRLLGDLGAGMDVVSGGEMERAWLSGTKMENIVFAGVGKSDAEIRAALSGRFSPLLETPGILEGLDPSDRGPVGLFNVESESELASIARLGAELGIRAKGCVRVNPNVDPHTHEYTTTGKKENKFGIDADQIVGLFDRWRGNPGVELVGLHVHIGSPVPKVEPYVEAIGVVLTLVDDLAKRGHKVEVLDLGGGWPVPYRDGEVPPLEDYGAAIVPLLADRVASGLRVCLEPGRSILANSGILVTRIEHIKRGKAKTFIIGDAGMHTMMRPALYKAFHFVWPEKWDGEPPVWQEDPGLPGLEICDLVGPICETGDFLARDRPLPPVSQGDLMVMFSAGAYGMSMVSNYNDHGRPAEVLVDGDIATVINRRQSIASIFETEMEPQVLDLESSDRG